MLMFQLSSEPSILKIIQSISKVKQANISPLLLSTPTASHCQQHWLLLLPPASLAAATPQPWRTTPPPRRPPVTATGANQTTQPSFAADSAIVFPCSVLQSATLQWLPSHFPALFGHLMPPWLPPTPPSTFPTPSPAKTVPPPAPDQPPNPMCIKVVRKTLAWSWIILSFWVRFSCD